MEYNIVFTNYKNKKNFSKLLSLFLIIIVFTFSACNNKNAEVIKEDKTTVNLRDKNWIEDIDYLTNNLEKSHKNLYHSIKKEDFYKQMEELKKNVTELNDSEIKFRLAAIVASVGDAHTSLNLGIDFNKIYPLKLWWFNEDLRVIQAEIENKDILGKKLIKINDIPIKEVFNKVNSIISHENNQWLKVINTQYVLLPELLKAFNISTEENLNITLQDDENNTQKIDISPINANNFKPSNSVQLSDDFITKPIKMQFNGKNLEENLYWFKYIPQDKILYFQYNQCIDRDIAKQYGRKDYESYPVFDEFSNKLLKSIEDNDVDKLIVDLRNNTGGNSNLMTNLVSKLKKIEKLKGKSKIFVLVGRTTYSSGVMAAMDFKKNTNAIFYGEPTGGNVNGYGDIKNIVLPNSKLQVNYSTKYFHLSDEYKGEFIPDKIVIEQFSEYRKGIDTAYEMIKNYTN